MLAGCEKNNTVQTCIISNEQYQEKDALEKAVQPESVIAGKEVYASIYFIESPKGMAYTMKWYIDGTEVKTEEKEMKEDKHGMIVFSLEADKVVGKTLKCELKYKEDILKTVELSIQ
jgi:hypothetical protein